MIGPSETPKSDQMILIDIRGATAKALREAEQKMDQARQSMDKARADLIVAEERLRMAHEHLDVMRVLREKVG